MKTEEENNTDKKIVVIGSSSIDFTTYSQRLPAPGETIHGYKFTTSFGGKGANQCVAAAKLGAKTYMICTLGDDQWGKKYKDHLKEIGVEITYVSTASNVTTGIAQITVAENGENQIASWKRLLNRLWRPSSFVMVLKYLMLHQLGKILVISCSTVLFYVLMNLKHLYLSILLLMKRTLLRPLIHYWTMDVKQ
ncbi:unnamed protein product, partial [Iphiclides podalirius]